MLFCFIRRLYWQVTEFSDIVWKTYSSSFNYEDFQFCPVHRHVFNLCTSVRETIGFLSLNIMLHCKLFHSFHNQSSDFSFTIWLWTKTFLHTKYMQSEKHYKITRKVALNTDMKTFNDIILLQYNEMLFKYIDSNCLK